MILSGNIAISRGLAHACVLCCTFIWLNSCSSPTAYIEDSRAFSSTLIRDIDKELSIEETARSGQLSFQQACLESARNDRNIVSILEKFNQANIEFDGVKTHLWPRLNLGATSEIPLSGSSDADFDLNGGIYFNYDIRRAIAVGDESTLKKTEADQYLYRLRLALNMLQKELKNHLNQISFLTFKTEKKAQAFELARSALKLAEVYAGQKRINVSTLAEWRKKVNSLLVEQQTIQNQLKAEEFAVADMLGRNVFDNIVITDAAGILEDGSIVTQQEYSPSEVWNRHSEARLYELELIAAEAGAQLVALERLPEIDAELGLGDIPLEGSDNKASSLMRLTLTMPLYDFGDHSRKVALSEITRNRVKSSMKFNITRLYNRAQLARSAHAAAQDNLVRASSAVREGKEMIAKKNMLISESRGDNLSLFSDRLYLADLEVLQMEAETAVRKTADDLRLATGEDMVPDSIHDLIMALQ